MNIGEMMEQFEKEKRERGKRKISDRVDAEHDRPAVPEAETADASAAPDHEAEEKPAPGQMNRKDELPPERPAEEHQKRTDEEKPHSRQEGAAYREIPGERKRPERPGTIVAIGIILDATYSFRTVFPAVYYLLTNFFDEIKRIKKEYRGISFQYGLTLLHENAEPYTFPGKKIFTDSEEEFIKALEDIEFKGGGEDGRENLNEALDLQLEKLMKRQTAGYDKKGIMMFSDSLPPKNELQPDFSSGECGSGGYTNKGLRFADFYVYSDDYLPKMYMVNSDGTSSDEARNFARCFSIRELIKLDPGEAVKQIIKNVDTISKAVSVR